MNYDLKVGFSRVNITPPLGIKLLGYYHIRYADGVLDELEVNALAINKNDSTALIVAVDNALLPKKVVDLAKDEILKLVNVSKECIFINSTHTHTAPALAIEGECFEIESTEDFTIEIEYTKTLVKKIASACKMAIDDLTPAKMGHAVSKAERISFNRRYLMKDGTTQTNPGVNNPNVVKSIGLLDESVNVLRFTREDNQNIVVINFGCHPDTIGGNKVSGDWPTLTRHVFERTIENSKCIMLNGIQGDVNHVNVFPKGGDLNGMINDFDDVTRGYSHAKHMANVVAAAAISVFEKVEYVDSNSVNFKEVTIDIPLHKATPEELVEAKYIYQMHLDGRDSELPYKGMLLTTMLAGAKRKVTLENAPDTIKVNLTAVKVGDIAFIGFPGEPFTGVGLGVKQAKGYKMVLPCCITNDSVGYFPMKDSYAEGGYEANSSHYAPGTAELLIEKALEVLKNI